MSEQRDALGEAYAGLATELAAELAAELTAGLASGGTCPRCGEELVRIGTDVQAISEVADALQMHGERYLARVFVTGELADSGIDLPLVADSPPEPGPLASLAARYAAKEATIKVLRPVQTGLWWPEIEIVRTRVGWCRLVLHGRCATLADEAALTGWSVSLAHDAGVAVATVLALHHCSDTSGTRST